MRGIVFDGNKTIEERIFQDPSPGPNQVVIQMKSSGLCGSDLKPYRASKLELGKRAETICGHEPCGQVVAIGENVTNVKTDDRIIVHHYSGCRICKYCLSGWTQLCQSDKQRVYGFNAHGANADYQLIEDYMCVPMPDALSYEEGAAIACGTGTAFQALRRLNLSGKDVIAIFGQGPVGLSATFLGSHMGARILAVDPIPERRKLAIDLGAWATVDPGKYDSVTQIMELTSGQGADCTLDATGIGSVRAEAIRSTKIWGRACLVGEGGDLNLQPSPDIIHRQINLYGSWTFSTLILKELSEWVVNRELPLSNIITHRYSLDDVSKAFEIFNQGKTGKAVINWN